MGVEESMANIRRFQAEAASKKEAEAKAVAEAVETATKEKAEALESMTEEREQVEGEMNNISQELLKFASALAEVGAIDLGELDPDSQVAVQAEIAGIQAEEAEKKAQFNDLAEKKANLDTKIAVLGGGEAVTSEIPAEAPAEAPAETQAEVPVAEIPAESAGGV